MKFWPAKKNRRKIYLILFILAMPVTWYGYRLIKGKPLNINHFFDRIFIEFAVSSPEMLTGLGAIENTALDFHSGKLNDLTVENEDKSLVKLKRDLATLRSYDPGKLTESQKLSVDILDWFMQGNLEQADFRYQGYRLTQLGGIHTDFPSFMTASHQITADKGADNYLKRLKAFDKKVQQTMEMLKIQEQEGVLPPKFVLQRVLGDMDTFMEPAPKDNILVNHLKEKLDEFADLKPARKDQLVADSEQVVADVIYPAYRNLRAFIADQATRAGTDDGVWAIPRGDEYYQALLRNYTTTEYTPDEIHAMGLKEVARIREEMEWLLESLGYTEQPFAEAIQGLTKDPRFVYPDSELGRDQIMQGYQGIIDEISKGMDKAFYNPPSQQVEVVAVAKFQEATAPLAYYNPPGMDGKRPGMFFANLGQTEAHFKWGMRTLAYHEAIPGHHFQYSLAMNLKGLPIFRTMVPFTAYSEGWALYAERLAWELGYQEDPYNNLGRLQAEMFRAARLVVDTGIHDKRWTRQKAIDYMAENTGMEPGEVRIEIERYVVWPGQACAYKVGMMKILELRKRAKDAMGDRFDLRDFHSVVLDQGQMPLSILEQQVDLWIAEQSKK